MAKSKAQLKLEFLEIGGDPKLIPDDLEQIKADDIEKLIESRKEQIKLEQQLQGSGVGSTEGTSPTDEKPAADAPKAPEAPKTTEPTGIKFRLTGASRYGTGKLPGKFYDAGAPIYVTDANEAKILRASGMFKEGDE